MANTLERFVAGLKQKLRTLDAYDFVDSGYYDYGGETGGGTDVQVDWDVLDAEIDKFCAEFKQKNEDS